MANPTLPKPPAPKNESDLTSDEEVNPEIEATEETKKAPKVVEKKATKGIMVVATMPGFFGNVRRVEGDQFMIANEKQLGSWMKKI